MTIMAEPAPAGACTAPIAQNATAPNDCPPWCKDHRGDTHFGTFQGRTPGGDAQISVWQPAWTPATPDDLAFVEVTVNGATTFAGELSAMLAAFAALGAVLPSDLVR